MIYNKANEYNPLKSIVLGRYYTADYFDEIDVDAVRVPLKNIANEINEDLENFKSTLESYGVHVVQPELPDRETFWQHHRDTGRFLMPPIAPRNCHTVIGKSMYRLKKENELIVQCVENYNPDVVDLSEPNIKFFNESIDQHQDCYNQNLKVWYRRQKYQELRGKDWPNFADYVQGARSNIPAIAHELDQFETALCYESSGVRPVEAPNMFPTDLGLVVDSNEYCDYTSWIRQHVDYHGPVVKINTGADHSDGCFSLLGNNIILGIDPLIDYHAAFPGHTVIPVPPQNYMNQVQGYQKMEFKVGGKWWVPGQEDNQVFIDYVENYLNDWTGFVQESVFDVNVLSLNPETVFVTGDNPEITKQLIKHGINPIVIPWRHRFFIDGGLHCITLDLCRE